MFALLKLFAPATRKTFAVIGVTCVVCRFFCSIGHVNRNSCLLFKFLGLAVPTFDMDLNLTNPKELIRGLISTLTCQCRALRSRLSWKPLVICSPAGEVNCFHKTQT